MNLADLLEANAADVAALPASVLAALSDEFAALSDRTKRIGNVLDMALQERYARGLNGPGTTHVSDDGFDVKISVGKRVDWDKEMLYDLADQNDNSEWIDWTPSVAESRYKAAPDRVKGALEAARTVKMSKPKIEFIKKE